MQPGGARPGDGRTAPRATHYLLARVRRFAIRPGWLTNPSAPRLAEVPAAILPQCDAPPEVAGKLAELLGERHRLIEVGQEVTDRRSIRQLEVSLGSLSPVHSGNGAHATTDRATLCRLWLPARRRRRDSSPGRSTGNPRRPARSIRRRRVPSHNPRRNRCQCLTTASTDPALRRTSAPPAQ